MLVEDYAVEYQGGIEVLDSGAIRVRARLARTGVQEYDNYPGREGKVRLLRPADEVFADASLATLRSNPITVRHPKDGEVRVQNWRERAVGHVESHEIKRATVDSAADGHGEDFVQASLVIFDPATIDAIQRKELREFSSGYAMTVDWTPGTYKGVAYDGVQRGIRHNHQAILGANEARAGREARILDSNPGNTMTLEEALKALTDAKAEIEKLKADHKTALDAKDAALGAALAKATPAAPTLDAAAIEAAVSERIALVDVARPMLAKDYAYTGKSNKQIKLDAIKACRPDLSKALGDAPSDGMVDGAFLTLADAKTVYVQKDPAPTGDSQTKSPRQVYLDALEAAAAKSRGEK